jgi:hypothetical protein
VPLFVTALDRRISPAAQERGVMFWMRRTGFGPNAQKKLSEALAEESLGAVGAR